MGREKTRQSFETSSEGEETRPVDRTLVHLAFLGKEQDPSLCLLGTIARLSDCKRLPGQTISAASGHCLRGLSVHV